MIQLLCSIASGYLTEYFFSVSTLCISNSLQHTCTASATIAPVSIVHKCDSECKFITGTKQTVEREELSINDS